jgi:molybdopterin molybdotransferase
MDGYAVRARDIREANPSHPVVLAVKGEIRAGVAPRDPLVAGTAMRIMTGAPVPPGADAIVRVEDTDAEEAPGRVRVYASSAPGKDIRPRAQDMLEGDLLLERGTTVGPGQIGLAAATGVTELEVFRRPRVGILSNGDEIAPPGEFRRVQTGEAIPETNSPTLAAGVRGAGGVPLSLGIARDTPESILQKLGEAREAGVEVLVTSGGASMGELDLFKRVLDREGFRLDFWRVKMRPGTPFSFGTLPSGKDGAPIFVFGLPGNPASSFVTFQIFCRPFLLRMGGHRRVHRPVLSARAGQAFRSRKHLTHFFRVNLSGDPPFPVATTTGSQTSGLVRGQGLAQGLGVVPAGVEEVPEGDPIRVILLDDFGHGEEQPGYLAP